MRKYHMYIEYVHTGHQENWEELLQNADFNYSRIIRMLYSPSSSDEVRLLAGSALAAFAFKNASSQKAIGQQGGLSFSSFLPFLRSADQLHRCQAAFQVNTPQQRIVTNYMYCYIVMQFIVLQSITLLSAYYHSF